MLIKLACISFGASLGAISRFGLAIVAKDISQLWNFPAGTLIANLLGCFFIGFLGEVSLIKHIFSPNTEAIIFTGFIGSLTTFSTFSHETVKMFTNGARLNSALYIIGSLIIGLSFVITGMVAASFIYKK